MNEQPLYLKVKEHILANIASGAWPPGARVPSEHELVQQFSISRMTANRALKELSSDGWLNRIAGVGTFVSEPRARASLVELKDTPPPPRWRTSSRRQTAWRCSTYSSFTTRTACRSRSRIAG